MLYVSVPYCEYLSLLLGLVCINLGKQRLQDVKTIMLKLIVYFLDETILWLWELFVVFTHFQLVIVSCKERHLH